MHCQILGVARALQNQALACSALCYLCQQASEQHYHLLQQLEQVTQQLAVAQATQRNLEQQLQEQAEHHQVVLSDQQAVHDSSSKKMFRELKAAQAAKEQALAGKRVAEQATRYVSSGKPAGLA
jgi:hypothetical protein